MDFREVLGTKIAANRRHLRLSVQAAAKQAGIARDTWTKIENGRSVHDTNLQAALDLVGLDDKGNYVGGATQDAQQYVGAPGERAEHGESANETLAAIRAMRDDVLAMEERLAEQISDVSARVGRLEHGAEPVDSAGGTP